MKVEIVQLSGKHGKDLVTLCLYMDLTLLYGTLTDNGGAMDGFVCPVRNY